MIQNPQCSVMYLSLVRPPHALDMKETVPCGVIPIRNFTVLWCLYDDHVSALALRFDGRSINTSKQSIMTAHLLPKCFLNSIGMVFLKSSLSGHTTSGLILRYITVMTSVIILETVDNETPNSYARNFAETSGAASLG